MKLSHKTTNFATLSHLYASSRSKEEFLAQVTLEPQERWKLSAFPPKISPLKPLIFPSEQLLWSSLQDVWLNSRFKQVCEMKDEVSPLVFPSPNSAKARWKMKKIWSRFGFSKVKKDLVKV